MYLRICGVLRLQKNNWLRKSRKLYGPQIANPQIAAFVASSANKKQMLSANLLSAELSCGQPTSGNLLGNFAIFEQKRLLTSLLRKKHL
jgi:hypothetical protein